MKRREILRYTALATGASIGAPILSSILSGCQSEIGDESTTYTSLIFNKEEFNLLKDLVDTILPKSDIPSATDVGVHKVIDSMVGKVYNKIDREAYLKGFKLFESYLNSQAGQGGFQNLKVDKKLELLKSVDGSSESELKDIRNAYLSLKQQTIAYYLSTEEIGKNYLNYLPVPGEYESCIPLSDVGGKAWAL